MVEHGDVLSLVGAKYQLRKGTGEEYHWIE